MHTHPPSSAPNGSLAPVDLNLLVDLPVGVTLRQAYDINNAGQILASGTGGLYVLTPVPERVCAAVLAFVAALNCRRRALRQRRNENGPGTRSESRGLS